MRFTRNKLIIGSAVAVLAAGGTGVALATSSDGDDGEGTVTGPAASEARAAALDITNGGKANSVERDGENGATWEVEVTRTDGSTVDVRLDEQYKLVVIEGDSEKD